MAILLSFSLVDIAVFIFILIGCVQGFFRGLSGELARLISVLAAFVAGTLLYEPIGLWLSDYSRLGAREAQALVFVITLFVTFIVMLVLRILLRKLIKFIFAPGFDHVAGVVAGCLRMGIIVCVFFMIMNIIPVNYLNRQFGTNSIIGKGIAKYIPSVEHTLERIGVVPINAHENRSDD